jgi:hypothetical protein
MKRGRGGRSSFSGDVVTVFGANGLVGRGVANRLGKNGSQMVFPYRGDHYKMMRLKVIFPLLGLVTIDILLMPPFVFMFPHFSF